MDVKEFSAEEISARLLLDVKRDEPVSDILKELEGMDYAHLLWELKTDKSKLAFWVNIYNAFSLLLLNRNPELIASRSARNTHFNAAKINVAGKYFSFNQIEHGILRNSRVWWSRGYLRKLFPGQRERELRVQKLDHRIHFALNCGGASCPPIRFYESANLEKQLNIATKAFLFTETSYDASNGVATVSRLLDWYLADFGGKKGIVKMLKEHKVIPPDADPEIGFSSYDWNVKVNIA